MTSMWKREGEVVEMVARAEAGFLLYSGVKMEG